jgi:hypothetical protein
VKGGSHLRNIGSRGDAECGETQSGYEDDGEETQERSHNAQTLPATAGELVAD